MTKKNGIPFLWNSLAVQERERQREKKIGIHDAWCRLNWITFFTCSVFHSAHDMATKKNYRKKNCYLFQAEFVFYRSVSNISFGTIQQSNNKNNQKFWIGSKLWFHLNRFKLDFHRFFSTDFGKNKSNDNEHFHSFPRNRGLFWNSLRSKSCLCVWKMTHFDWHSFNSFRDHDTNFILMFNMSFSTTLFQSSNGHSFCAGLLLAIISSSEIQFPWMRGWFLFEQEIECRQYFW